MADINSAFAAIEKAGFLDIDIDPSIDLFAEIEKLKKEKTQSYWLIITRSRIFRMWPIILVIASA